MIFKTTFQLSFRLADPAGIMFFGNILDITHDSFEQFIQAAGFAWNEWFDAEKDLACPIRHIDVDFRAPFIPGEHYDVHISVVKLGSSSFTLKHEFKKNQALHACVTVTHAFANKSNFTKAEMPADVRLKLNPYLEK